MKSEQRQRQAEGGLEFEVREVRHAIRIETERDAADGARGVTSGEHPRQRVRRKGRQHETGDEGDVVGENRRSASHSTGPAINSSPTR